MDLFADVINEEALDKMDSSMLESVLSILEKAGY